MKTLLKSILPPPVLNTLRTTKSFVINMQRDISGKIFEIFLWHAKREYIVKALKAYGLNVSEISDFYSPLPVVEKLKENMKRWFKPSELVGINYDIEAMKHLLQQLISKYYGEYSKLPSFEENRVKGYGPGFTIIDAMIEYYMIRHIRPHKIIEIGSGLSTYYCYLASKENLKDSKPLNITCVDPYPFEKQYDIPEIEIIKKEVQDIELSFFQQLGERDVLFIDSTHSIKIDGDVPYLYLEVIPRLNKGVIIHVHDVHFPYNIPYPPQLFIFGWKRRPAFWTEAMLLQAFLSYNEAYKIILSVPLLRFFCEDFLLNNIPDYEPLKQEKPDTYFSSIWLEKVK